MAVEFRASSSFKIPIEYEEAPSFNSNMDVYEWLQPEDMKQEAVIVAALFTTPAIGREPNGCLRKPIEKPLPKETQKGKEEKKVNKPDPLCRLPLRRVANFKQLAVRGLCPKAPKHLRRREGGIFNGASRLLQLPPSHSQ